MEYPIFNSIITIIEAELNKRDITPVRFKVWQDNTLHATGLEIGLKMSDGGSGVKEITINFDWDTFREAKLAATLKGMEQHPLLKRKQLRESKADLTLDIETAWHFDEKQILGSSSEEDCNLCKVEAAEATDDARTAYASAWMHALNLEIARFLPQENIISRWHLEVEGDLHGKYVSDMSLLAYHQFPLYAMKHLAEVHSQIRISLQKILSRVLRMLSLASRTRPVAA